jgi:Mg/Co/Ni transporter MgtE
MQQLPELLHRNMEPLSLHHTVAEALDWFNDFPYSHLPIVDEGVFLGNIALEDAETLNENEPLNNHRYLLHGFFVRDHFNWLDVLEELAKNEANVVPVLQDDQQFVGCYLLEEVVQLLAETPFLKETGGIIVVEKSIKDYSMGQITQIIESNNGRILGAFVSHIGTENIQVTLKLTLGPMNDILQAFRRYNYEVVSEHHEDSYLENLKERSAYLAKFLNI